MTKEDENEIEFWERLSSNLAKQIEEKAKEKKEKNNE